MNDSLRRYNKESEHLSTIDVGESTPCTAPGDMERGQYKMRAKYQINNEMRLVMTPYKNDLWSNSILKANLERKNCPKSYKVTEHSSITNNQ